MAKPKAYSYTRMSTPEQLRGDSRRRQEERAKKYAAEHGLEIADRFDDFGVSAFKGKNAELGALSEFTRLVDEGAIERGSYLLVESMDRLTRQTVPRAMSLLLGLTNRGINVAILDDNRVYSERSNEEDTYALMTALVSMSRAHDESKRKSSMLSEAWKNKRRLAREVGKITTSRCPGWLRVNRDKNLVEVIPERAKVVREIFEWARSGHGAYSIARKLNKRREAPWSTRENAVWRESYIKKILKSRTVLGEYQPHTVVSVGGKVTRVPDGKPLIDYYPAVVPLELFHEANLAMERRGVSGRGRKGRAYSNLFTGLLRCQCGAGYRFISKGRSPKGGQYLQCSVAFSKGACAATAFRYEPFEAWLLEVVEKLDIGSLIGGSKLSERVRQLKQERAELADRLKHQESEAQNLLAAIKAGGSSSKLLASELAKIESSIAASQNAIAAIEREFDDLSRVDADRRRSQLHTLMSQISEASGESRHEKRRALAGELQRLLRKIVVTPQRYDTWELIDVYPNWRQDFGVQTQKELERFCRDYGYDLLLVYRSGDTLHVNAIEGEVHEVRQDLRMKTMRSLARDD
ncbi:MAG TPA: recombinase family protein [Lysobacter sp.]|nr:recombinase family protein [Lysobacter sp.]